MLKILFIIVGSIVISTALLRSLLPARIFDNWKKATTVRIIILLVFVFLFSITFIIYKAGVDKGTPKSEVIEKIKNLESNQIHSIILNNCGTHGYISNDTLIIKCDSLKTEFISAIREIDSNDPINYVSIWSCEVRINLINNQLDDVMLRVNKLRDSGYHLSILKKNLNSEFKLGTFKCRDLGLLIEEIYKQNEANSL